MAFRFSRLPSSMKCWEASRNTLWRSCIPHESSIEMSSQSPALSRALDQDSGVPAPELLVEPRSFLSTSPNFSNECFIPFATSSDFFPVYAKSSQKSSHAPSGWLTVVLSLFQTELSRTSCPFWPPSDCAKIGTFSTTRLWIN